MKRVISNTFFKFYYLEQRSFYLGIRSLMNTIGEEISHSTLCKRKTFYVADHQSLY